MRNGHCLQLFFSLSQANIVAKISMIHDKNNIPINAALLMLSQARASAHNYFRLPMLGMWPTNLDHSLRVNESVMLSGTNTELSIKSNDSLSVGQLYIPLHLILYYDRQPEPCKWKQYPTICRVSNF